MCPSLSPIPPSHVSILLDIPEGIVESNPRKFHLDAAELTKRKAFITDTRRTVQVGLTFPYRVLRAGPTRYSAGSLFNRT